MVNNNLVFCVSPKNLFRRVVVKRSIRVRVDRQDTIMSLISRDSISLCQGVGALMARASIEPRWDFKCYLPYRVTIFAIFGASTSSIRVNCTVNVSTVTVKCGPITIQGVGGARQLSRCLVSSIVMSSVGTYAIGTYRTFVLQYQSVLTVVNATRER